MWTYLRTHYYIKWGMTAATSAALIGLYALAALTGCGLSPPNPDKLTILLTGDSRGYLEPCGCRRNQAGGLPVRATLVRRASKDDPLLFDVGNITSGSRTYELLKLRYLVQGMHKLDYDAVNIGQTDAQLDVATLKTEMSEGPLPFVSANVFDYRTGQPVTEQFRIIRRGGLRIGVTGVVGDGNDPETAYGPGLLVKPPVEALEPVIAEMKTECDYLVVLSWSTQDTINTIGSRYPEVNAIFGGNVPQSSGSVMTINRAINFNVVNQGKVIGQIDLKRSGSSYEVADSAGIKVATTGIPGSPDMIDLIGHYKDELRNRRYELAGDEGMDSIDSQTSTADQYVGSAACASCHKPQEDIYIHTKHQIAFATLVAKNSEYDPECLRCHTVGYGLYSGFVDSIKTPQLENVQCESCHGRGKEHVLAMQTSLISHQSVTQSQTASGLKAVTPATCVKCHDKENSEDFTYARFWPKISH